MAGKLFPFYASVASSPAAGKYENTVLLHFVQERDRLCMKLNA
jgi:hypothetical protein